MAVIMEVWKEFDLTVLEKNTAPTCKPARDERPGKLQIKAPEKEWTQISELVDFGGFITATPILTVDRYQPTLPASLAVLPARQAELYYR